MAMTRVLLVALYRYQNYPVRILHALLERLPGVEPHAIFFKNRLTNAASPPTAREEALFAERIRAIDPALVGLSVTSPYVETARRLSASVRRAGSARILWGGIHPTIFPEESLAEADEICVGEAEGALVERVAALRDGGDHRRIANLWVREAGRVFRNPLRPLVGDLDALPFPAVGRERFAFIEDGRIAAEDPWSRDPVLPVLPARGCPFACTYCVNSLLKPLFRGLGPFVRRRSVGSVIAEIREMLDRPGSRHAMVEFHDENFGTDPAWLAEFEARYPAEVGLPFKVQYNPMLVAPETIQRLRRAGLHRVKFGIEAGTDAIRNRIFGRPGKNAAILDLARRIAGSGVKIRYDFILDNPYDDEASLAETLRLFLELPKPLRANLYSLQYFPGYPLTARAIADGRIGPEAARLETLAGRMARNWAFVPRMLPFRRREMLQNMVWLYTAGRVGDGRLSRAAFGRGAGARLMLAALHLKAAALGRIQEARRRLSRRAPE
jgi:radical SAM superfamily enzyme YgiQ (UPF0313 family)